MDHAGVVARWAMNLMSKAFVELALDFADTDRRGAITALSRVELLVADELAAFREFYPERDGIDQVDFTLAGVLDEMGAFEFIRNVRPGG